MAIETSTPIESEAGLEGAGDAVRWIRDVSAARVLGVGLLLGIAFDYLFHGKALGISFLLFIVLLLGALAVLGRLDDVPPARRNLWLVVPLLFYAAMVFVRANEFLTFLNVVYSLGLLVHLLVIHVPGGLERQQRAAKVASVVREQRYPCALRGAGRPRSHGRHRGATVVAQPRHHRAQGVQGCDERPVG